MKLFNKTNNHISRRPQDSFVHRVANDPYLDWFILVMITVVFSGVVIGVGFISYNWVQDELSAPSKSSDSGRQILFDDGAMSKILDNFEDRATEQVNLRKGYTGVADPSL